MATKIYLCIIVLIKFIILSNSETYTVRIKDEQHVNLVDSRFLSFTVDPKYLFSTSEKYKSKECICMASSLSPAYIRIAGPSTAHMSFYNTTITIDDLDFEFRNDDFEVTAIDADIPKKVPLELTTKKLTVTHREWRQFIHWAKSTGFDLIFALNNEERTPSGMWDPNTALNILTVAEKVKVGDIFWELGYECTNQSIEDYLNDLETLRVIVETFPPGRTGEWKVVSGDVSKCLQADCKSDFKDYITLSEDMMDALLLNGNSSAHELDRMSEIDRMRLLRYLFHSNTPLWLTENNQRKYNQLERAADWLASLGYSAKNGFSVNFRELEAEEMYEPTLSFYMALLFKNLVGERVLNVEMNPDQAILFAHCTSLRHKPVPGAVTLFGVNMDDEPARFALKLSKQEDGGDIMQFILGHDHSGNIIVNGRAMYYEGDIRPVLKRVSPYKTLLVNLPPKSFGFWVLANTKIEACQDKNDINKSITEEENVTENLRIKRSIDYDFEDYTHTADLSYDFDDFDILTTANIALKTKIAEINRDLNRIHNAFLSNIGRFKRQDDNHSTGRKIYRKQKLKTRNHKDKSELDLNPKALIGNILQKARKSVNVLKNRGLREIKKRMNRNRLSKRQSRNSSTKIAKSPVKYLDNFKTLTSKRSSLHRNMNNKNEVPIKIYKSSSKSEIMDKNIRRNKKASNIVKKKYEPEKKTASEGKETGKDDNIENHNLGEDNLHELPKIRKRRQIIESTEETTENDIESDKRNKAELWKMLKKIHEDLKDLPDKKRNVDEDDSREGIILKTELSDDTATIHVKDSSKGLITSAMKNMVNVLEDLNNNLSRFWDALSLLE